MVDSEIRPGDVCFDLSQGSKLQVLEIAADTVAEYREREDFDLTTYKSHPLFDVTDDETVYTCVYLPNEVTTPGASYDFPRSRLARIPVEETHQNLVRVQDTVVLDTLEAVFDSMVRYEGVDDDDIEAVADHIGGLPRNVVYDAREIAEAERFGGGEE